MPADQASNVAVVGTGFMGRVHTEALRRAGRQVLGVCGSSADKSSRAAAAWSIPRSYATFEDLLADRDIHAVHITSPNRHHFAQATAALEAGKHVLVEKPLAMNAAESSALVQLAAKKRNLAAGVNYNIRYYPLCLQAREMVRAGKLGTLFHMAGSYAQDWLLYDTDYNWRVLDAEGGALRAVADIGTHWLDLVQSIAGQPVVAVCADLKTVHARRRRPQGQVETFKNKEMQPAETESVPIATEDYGAMMLHFADGARGTLWVSQVTAGRKNCLRFEIAGQEGALAWNSEQPNELWLGRRDGPNGTLLRDPSLLSGSAQRAAELPGGHNEGYGDTFKQLFLDYYGYIDAGAFDTPPPFPTFADGHREIALCDAVLKSHRSGAWCEVDLTKGDGA